jgi:hypothetical protein
MFIHKWIELNCIENIIQDNQDIINENWNTKMVNSFIFKMCNSDPVIFLIVILFVIKKVMTIYLFDNNDLNGVDNWVAITHFKNEWIYHFCIPIFVNNFFLLKNEILWNINSKHNSAYCPFFANMLYFRWFHF